MKKIELTAEIRNTDEKLSAIRKNKQVPGVVYGHHQEPISLKVNNSDMVKIINTVGKSHIISLEVGKKKISVLIQEMQKHPVRGDFTHIDFYAITEGEKLHTHIPLNFVGESEAKKLGAILEEHIKEIEVKCLSKDLVDSIDVDLSSLKEFNDVIRVSDLKIDSSKFDLITKADDIVVIASEPAVQKVEEPVVVATTPEEDKTKTTEEK
ncbi:MAG: 50S ribosomal protein L25 [Candidatus Gracilibacteria bacterium]